MTRRIVLGAGALVVVLIVAWWPSLLDDLATMHEQPPPLHRQR